MTEPEDHHKSWTPELYAELRRVLLPQIQKRAPKLSAEDILHDAIWKSLRSHADVTTLIDAIAYVATAVWSVIADTVRKQNTNKVGSLEDLSEGNKKQLARRWTEDWLMAMKREESRDTLGVLASELKPRDRLVLKLKLEEISWEEMARVLGTDLAGARLRWASVLDKLHYVVKKKAAKQQTRRD